MKVELSTKELSILSDALNIDIISDDPAPPEKVALLNKLNALIQKYN